MNKKIEYLFFCCFLFCMPLLADDFDSCMRSKIAALPESYFVIGVDTREAPTINGVHTLRDVNDILSVTACKDFYFLVNNGGGIATDRMDDYFRQVLKIAPKDFKNKIIVDNNLYNRWQHGSANLNAVNLSETFYVYNRNLIYEKYSKVNRLRDNSFPYDLFHLKFLDSVAISQKEYMLTSNSIIKKLGEHILMLSTVDNTLRIFNETNGDYLKILHIDSLNAVEMYKQYVAENDTDKANADLYKEVLKKMNRKEVNSWNIMVKNNHIYLSAGLQVALPLKESSSFINEEGKKIIRKKGTLYGELFLVIIKLDTLLKVQGVIPVSDKGIPKKVLNVVFPASDVDFITENNDSTMYLLNSFDGPSQLGISAAKVKKMPFYNNSGASIFKLHNQKYLFQSFLKFPFYENPDAYEYELSNFGLYEFGKKYLARFEYSPDFLNVKTNKQAFSLKDSSQTEFPEQFMKSASDSNNYQHNWGVYVSKTIDSGKYFAVVYSFHEKGAISIFDTSNQKIQTISLKDFPPFNEWIATASLNYRLLDISDNGDIYFMKYNAALGTFFLYHYFLEKN